MRRIALLLAILLLPTVVAQSVTRPIEGDYDEVYIVAGRVTDAYGMPFAQASVEIEISSKKFNVAPKQYGTDCYGEFTAYFNLPPIPPGAKVRVQALAKDAEGKLVPNGAAVSALLDPFFRRTDVNVTLAGLYEHRCDPQQWRWNSTVSVRARVLNKTAPYTAGDQTFEAEPYNSTIIRMRYTSPTGVVTCPPLATGGDRCNLFITDERGDVKYTWIFGDEVPSAGNVTIILWNNATYTAAIHPMNRRAAMYIEATGQGAPPIPLETPFLAPAAVVALALALALARAPRARG